MIKQWEELEARATPGPWLKRKEWAGDEAFEIYPDVKLDHGFAPGELCIVKNYEKEGACNNSTALRKVVEAAKRFKVADRAAEKHQAIDDLFAALAALEGK